MTQTRERGPAGEGVHIDHEFKSHPSVFWPAARGEKTFEYRRDDRGGYEIGQTVRLRCYTPDAGYTPVDPLDRRITNILHGGEFELPEGFCILSLAPLDPASQAAPAAGVEYIFGDFDAADYKPDLASAIAVEIMSLKWTHAVPDGVQFTDEAAQDEHCNRYGEVQEVVSAALAKAKIQPHTVLSPPPGDAERLDLGELERLSEAARAFAEAAVVRRAATMAYHVAWNEQTARGIQPRDMDLTAVGENSRKAQGAESLANVDLCKAAEAALATIRSSQAGEVRG